MIGGGLVQSLPGHTDIATCVAFSKKGIVLVSGGRDTSICVYRFQQSSYVLKRKIYGHASPLIAVDVNEDVDAIVSVSVWLFSYG